ncbi:MAG: tRNA preQ1(34) S-adenosylmethionine ribosyltransferase-isomerase QueA [Selenomonadales bacterium]|jgi:S-adenosylmethionine:tRNA ribosyltransferase-isomerase|nr:tRNA preQ1(34) S-adenosylmethionine ribosyltransferase-isomerase QueA [Clostridiales bacterium]PWL99806.1 MAG: tRNA preQ1(34) S-adenosylmethionine ribosyltransferase-isomerase QueA [Selenomonadales bacterium]
MFDYELPKEFIAQTPAEPRDHSKLLVYERQTDAVRHRHFYNLPEYLRAGDVLVINETRVLPARLMGRRETGGVIELLLLNRREKDIWETLARPGRRIRPGDRLVFSEGLSADVLESLEDGGRLVRFNYDGVFEEILDALGQMPLPPYITERLENKERYQTVYSKETGSSAAPTAGLHFTPELLNKIREMGVKIVPVLLHVGLGTFRPVKVRDVAEHKMHSEYYSLSPQAADAINKAKASGGRIISVGTTSTRVLETVCGEDGVIRARTGWTDIFIYPGYKFKCVDCLITNFHLPQSTLLMLVSAFCSREKILEIYEEAKKEDYRFFSFGDAMLII